MLAAAPRGDVVHGQADLRQDCARSMDAVGESGSARPPGRNTSRAGVAAPHRCGANGDGPRVASHRLPSPPGTPQLAPEYKTVRFLHGVSTPSAHAPPSLGGRSNRSKRSWQVAQDSCRSSTLCPQGRTGTSDDSSRGRGSPPLRAGRGGRGIVREEGPPCDGGGPDGPCMLSSRCGASIRGVPSL